jgi:hypothetical protein
MRSRTLIARTYSLSVHVARFLDVDIPVLFAQTAIVVRRQRESLEGKQGFVQRALRNFFIKGSLNNERKLVYDQQ